MIRRPPRSTLSSSSAASDVYKRQTLIDIHTGGGFKGSPNELAGHIRDFVPFLVQHAIRHKMHVAIFTNSRQVELIRGALVLRMPTIDARTILIRGQGSNWGVPPGNIGKHAHMLAAMGHFDSLQVSQCHDQANQRHGQVGQLAFRSICLLDDDIDSIKQAHQDRSYAVYCPPDLRPDETAEILLESLTTIRKHRGQQASATPESVTPTASIPQVSSPRELAKKERREQERQLAQGNKHVVPALLQSNSATPTPHKPPVSTLGMRLSPRPNQSGYKPRPSCRNRNVPMTKAELQRQQALLDGQNPKA
eukprot:TRINITY_DN20262_c0_g1_i1.p1 TRINITY_DN20262_c0_g1~~TRINITY_DN20262_c0_g1_i1.p1  ORF type:complete len:307 (-),score=51.98 TRINITY_DN20262_c0_g1_i1:349-1269(-)